MIDNLIIGRRSVRKYSPDPVSEEVLEACLDAARMAPSACNSQPWFFHVCRSEKAKNAVADAMNSGIYGRGLNRFVQEAPVIVAVETLKREKTAPWLAGMVRNVRYETMDVAIAVDHLTLKAAELGLGTCWIGWFNERAVKSALGLPKTSRLDVMLTVGWPDDRPRPKKRKDREEIRRYL